MSYFLSSFPSFNSFFLFPFFSSFYFLYFCVVFFFSFFSLNVLASPFLMKIALQSERLQTQLYSTNRLKRCFLPGTREEKTKKADDVPWYQPLWEKIKYILTCCRTQPASSAAVSGGTADKPQPATQSDTYQEVGSDLIQTPDSAKSKIANWVKLKKPNSITVKYCSTAFQ